MVNKFELAGESSVDMAGERYGEQIGDSVEFALLSCSWLNCYTNLGTFTGRYKHTLNRFYYANRVGGLVNWLIIKQLVVYFL